MNTIQITNDEGQVVNYTETEVANAFNSYKQIRQQVNSLQDQLRKIRYDVRDFFSEGEWSDGETTCNKGDVNLLLERIGTNKLTTQYSGTFTITGSFTVEAEDEQEAESMFTDNVDICFDDGDYSMDNVEVFDVEDNE